MSSSIAQPTLCPQSCQRLTECVRQWSGVSIDPGKTYLISGRLKGLLTPENGETLTELLDKAQRPTGIRLREQIVDVMTTHETLFFRDSHPFETLVDEILPTLLGRSPEFQEDWDPLHRV